jgi:hypothetical protein
MDDSIVKEYGILGLVIVLLIRELLFVLQQRWTMSKNSGTEEILPKLNELGKVLEKIYAEVYNLKVAHERVDSNGVPLWYSRFRETKENLDEIKKELSTIKSLIIYKMHFDNRGGEEP